MSRRFRWVWASSAILAFAGFAVGGAAFLVSPWISPIGLAGACALGIVLCFAIALLLPGRVHSDDPPAWRGVPARWLASGAGGARLAVASEALAELIFARVTPTQINREIVKENDARDLAIVAAILAAIAPSVVWWMTHPALRVVNTSFEPLIVSVDGRALGFVPGIVGEDPNAGVVFRVPRGWRHLKAVTIDGTVIDETEARLGVGPNQVYAPASRGHCFWVEQRAYGRAQQPKPADLLLSSRRTFHTLPVPIDAWFLPNPKTPAPDLWFSGGIRRALRHGPCPAPGQVRDVEDPEPAR